MKNSLLLILLIAGLSIGCTETEEENSLASSSIVFSVESAMSSLSAVVDDHQGNSYSFYQQRMKSPTYIDQLLSFALPSAYASACTRRHNCIVAEPGIVRNVFDCNMSNNVNFEGNILISYYNASDALSADTCNNGFTVNGEYLTRTYSYSLDGARGGLLEVSSDTHTNYLQESIGGGGRLTRLSESSWQLDILGKSKKLTALGNNVIFNQSIKTSEPIIITTGLSRSDRYIHSGKIVVNHNAEEYTTEITPDQLQWGSSCCHPVSGSLRMTHSGSVTGESLMIFNGCGEGILSKDDLEVEIELSYCE